jgi:hypothetical protein
MLDFILLRDIIDFLELIVALPFAQFDLSQVLPAYPFFFFHAVPVLVAQDLALHLAAN